MLKKMNKIRKKINKIDKKIENSLNKRFLIIDKVSEFKKENKINIYDYKREEEILNKYSNNKIKSIYKTILFESKKYQQQFINNKSLLLGNNISYSKSKSIHNIISKILKNNLDYEIKDIPKNNIQTFINDLKNYKYSFFNITIPYKQKVIEYLDYINNIVINTNSCNLVLLKNNKLYGYNTDYYGALLMLKAYNFNINTNVFIFGSGATSNLLKYLFKKEYNIEVTIVSRNNENKEKNIISYPTFEKIEKQNYVLINATPLGNLNYIDKSPCSYEIANKANFLFDLNYNPRLSLFLSYNENRENGLKMLITQALYSHIIYYNLDFSKEKIEKIVNEIEKEYDRNNL